MRGFRLLVTSSGGEGRLLNPSADVAMQPVRLKTTQEHPALMRTMNPGDKATVDTLFLSWLVYGFPSIS